MAGGVVADQPQAGRLLACYRELAAAGGRPPVAAELARVLGLKPGTVRSLRSLLRQAGRWPAEDPGRPAGRALAPEAAERGGALLAEGWSAGEVSAALAARGLRASRRQLWALARREGIPLFHHRTDADLDRLASRARAEALREYRGRHRPGRPLGRPVLELAAVLGASLRKEAG